MSTPGRKQGSEAVARHSFSVGALKVDGGSAAVWRGRRRVVQDRVAVVFQAARSSRAAGLGGALAVVQARDLQRLPVDVERPRASRRSFASRKRASAFFRVASRAPKVGSPSAASSTDRFWSFFSWRTAAVPVHALAL